MESLAAVLILVSGLAHAVVNAILKSGRDKMSGRALIDASSALIVLPAAFFLPLPGAAWPWLAASWALHLGYLLSLIRAFERADMSVAYPVSRGIAPALAAALAVGVFGESVRPWTVAGIALVSAGVLAVGLSHRSGGRGLSWALLTGAWVAAYTVVDAQGVRAAPQAATYIVWFFLTMGLGIALFFALWRGRRFLVVAASEWRAGLSAGALSILTWGLALIAFRLGATPRLAALRETSVLFGAAIAVAFLGERLDRQRLAGIAAIALGAIVLVALA
jgi:drug/metabolite transporter (DMT)-like permease